MMLDQSEKQKLILSTAKNKTFDLMKEKDELNRDIEKLQNQKEHLQNESLEKALSKIDKWKLSLQETPITTPLHAKTAAKSIDEINQNNVKLEVEKTIINYEQSLNLNDKDKITNNFKTNKNKKFKRAEF